MEFHYRDHESTPPLSIQVNDSPAQTYVRLGQNTVMVMGEKSKYLSVRLNQSQCEAYFYAGTTTDGTVQVCIRSTDQILSGVYLHLNADVVLALAAVMPEMVEVARNIKECHVEKAC